MNGSTAPLVRRLAWPAVAGLVLAATWVWLAGSPTRDDGPSPLSLPPAATAVQDQPQVDLALPVETYEIFLSRDPFEPLVPAGGGGTGEGTDGSTTGSATTGTTTGTTGSTDSGSTSGTTGGTGCSGSSEVVCEGHVVTLVDVFVQDGVAGAQVQVDSTIYTVAAGDTFALSFRVLSIDPPCVTLLYGDDAFTLCEGERVLK